MAERLFLRLPDDPLYAPETSVPAGTMRELAVPEPLRDFVASVMTYREDLPDGQEVVERVLPDGAVRLLFELGEGAGARIVGATAAPVVLRLRGRMHGVSMTLRPGAAAALLGLPAAELAGREIALADLWGRAGGDWLDQMQQARTDAARASLAVAGLRQRLRGTDEAGVRQARRAAELITRAGGRLAVDEVAVAVGTGERRLPQVFRLHLGLSPRAWGRLARMHDCLRLLRQPVALPWTQVALDAGYYDQSHLINEFRALCGLTPDQFLQARAVSGSSKTMA
jgi:methylphosphotriester-DNA--protein-cysteine methyltransferase